MIKLTSEQIDVDTLLASVADAKCGAQVLFVGTTRQWTANATDAPELQESPLQEQALGQPALGEPSQSSGAATGIETSHLIYEAYEELAVAEMQRIVAEAMEKWPIRKYALVHRIGRVDPKCPSVAIVVSCPHRREAFEAAEWLIDEVKHRVPIWKQEHYVQTGPEWIHPTSGNCTCDSVRAEPSGLVSKSDVFDQQSKNE